MNEPKLPANSLQSKSLFFMRAAWISIGAIITWALFSYFVIKPQNVSLLHLIVWGMLMVGSSGLFLVGFIVSCINFYQNRKTADLVLKKQLLRHVLWSLPGLLLAMLLVFLLGFLIISVVQALFTVR